LIADTISDQVVEHAPANNSSFLIRLQGNLLLCRLPFLLYHHAGFQKIAPSQGVGKMKVFITGGTGFVGSHISSHLLQQGYHVSAIGRSPVQKRIHHQNFTYISSDTTIPGQWQEHVQDCDVAFNLAGKSIFTRWNPKAKQQIYDSRILTTRNLVDALSANTTLISTSAVGYYGDRGDEILTEDTSPGNDFLAKVGMDWENEALAAEKKGVRVAVTRFGIVLGKNGGAMEKMIPAFKFFLGGGLGDGKQWFSWIHVDDIAHASMFILNDPEVKGVFNFTSPEPIRNSDFTKLLGKVLNRPAVMPAPAFLIRLFAGEFGETLLNSCRAVPERLLEAGYEFRYPELIDALKDIVKQN
jgi:uncharacterized protein